MSWPVLPLGLLGSQASTSDNDTYQVSRSLRFNSLDSAYLSRTPSVAGNRKTWTFSAWVKRSTIGSAESNYIFGNAQAPIGINGVYLGFSSDALLFGDYGASAWDWYVLSSSLYRDTSAWYHVVAQYDTTQATASERVKLYVNGVRLTAFSASTYPGSSVDGRINQASVETAIGRLGTVTSSGYYGGYMAEVNFIDGQALTPSSFGETDATTGRWKAKTFTGTYGTNGFYLNFLNNSSTTTRNLLTYSEDFANGAWSNYQSTETSNVAVAPNGTTTADKLIPDAGALGGQFFRNFSAIDNTTYTLSIYAKAAEYTQLRLYIQRKATSATFDFADYDLTSATVTATYGSPTSTSIVSVGNGWYRVSISANVGTGGTATPGVNIQHIGSAGNGSNGILLWGAQLEDSGTLGPYFRTDASATASTLRLGSDSSVSAGGYNSFFANNLSVTPGTGNDSLVDSPTNFGSISTTLVDDTYQIGKSLRFNSADSATLTRTFANAGTSTTTATLSFWVKRNKLGTTQAFYQSNLSNYNLFYFRASDVLTFNFRNGGDYQSNEVFKDVSSWNHIVVVFDSTNATQADRFRFYINGARGTFVSAPLFTQGYTFEGELGASGVAKIIGNFYAGGYLADFQLAEYQFIDGQALSPESFAFREANTYLWKPKAFIGTYGAHGFYLSFSDNSGATATTLGKDSAPISGTHTIANNWAPNNFSVTEDTGNDSLVDSPTYYGTLSTTPSEDTYQISRSLRFKGTNTSLRRTPLASSNKKTWTWSGWVKRSKLGTVQQLFNRCDTTGSVDYTFLYFREDNTIQYLDSNAGAYSGATFGTNDLRTKTSFSDTSNWYHIVMAVDTTQLPETNRSKLYVNGTLINSFISRSYPGQNALTQINTNNSHYIGSNRQIEQFYEGYLAEVNFVDGLALTPESFGVRETGTYLWKPKAYTGAYGANGFYLKFTDSSTPAALGTDYSGNSNNLDVQGSISVATGTTSIVNNDSFIDVPTYYGTDNGAGGEARGSYCTLDPFNYASAGITLANGNLTLTTAAVNVNYPCGSTMSVSSGKWYFEVTISTAGASFPFVGIIPATNYLGNAVNVGVPSYTNSCWAGNGAFVSGDICGFAFDLNALTFTAYKNGVALTGSSVSSPTITSGLNWMVALSGVNGCVMHANFGQRAFRYAAPTGFKALRDFNKPPVQTGGELRGSYCTLNPLDKGSEVTLANGNLDVTWTGVNGHSVRSTQVISSGKWYWEVTSGGNASIGIIQSNIVPALNGWPGQSTYGATGSYAYAPDGRSVNNSTYSTYGSAISNGNIVGVAYDATNGRIFFSLNGTWQASGNPAAGTNAAYSGITGSFSPAIGYWTSPTSNVNSLNFGQRPWAFGAPFGFKPLRDYNKLPTPTGGEVRGNYCTLNPLHYNYDGVDLRNGNLDGYGVLTTTTPSARTYPSTIKIKSGKWYVELTVNATSNGHVLGIANTFDSYGNISYSDGYGYNFWDQVYLSSGGSLSYGVRATAGQVVGMAVDLDNGKLEWFVNGSSQGQKTGIISGEYFIAYYLARGTAGTVQSGSINFGQRPWAYDAPFGFLPLCTTSLPQPIVQKSSTAMDVVTYTGNSGTQTISSLGFSPDLVWLKGRSYSDYHTIYDTIRGATKSLSSDLTLGEVTRTIALTGFTSNGFTLGADTVSNFNNNTHVAWAWDAGSSSVANTSGAISSTVRANPQAGFSIVSFVNASGTNQSTVGHGLGSSPKMIIAKNRDTSANNWAVFHSSVCDTTSKFLQLNTTAALTTFATVWGASLPSSSVFGVTGGGIATASVNMIAYCFSEVEGYSKFGSYVGNGSADGPFVYCGFRPRWVMIKNATGTSNVNTGWYIFDSLRNTFNTLSNPLRADSSGLEASSYAIDFLVNGFKLRLSDVGINSSTGSTHIFAAFAEAPFKYARAR